MVRAFVIVGGMRMGQAIDQEFQRPLAGLDAVLLNADTEVTCSWLRLRGELDLSTAPDLERLLDQLRHQGHREIIVDLSGVEFLSAAGLSVFLRADRSLRAAGGRLLLIRPTRIARRVLTITGLDATLIIESGSRDRVAMSTHLDPGDAA